MQADRVLDGGFLENWGNTAAQRLSEKEAVILEEQNKPRSKACESKSVGSGDKQQCIDDRCDAGEQHGEAVLLGGGVL